jgi:hypothetical protein
MEITNAKYTTNGLPNENCNINCLIDGKNSYVPLEPGNRHYDEIMRQVEAGTLTIAEAE